MSSSSDAALLYWNHLVNQSLSETAWYNEYNEVLCVCARMCVCDDVSGEDYDK